MSEHPVKRRKKLIEVAIPLEAINQNAATEKNNPFLKGHPRNIHKWWARRPFGAAASIIFCQLVDDPSSCPEEFPTEKEATEERERLHAIAVQLSDWSRFSDKRIHDAALREIKRSLARLQADTNNNAKISLPSVWDPFAGGGAIPYAAMALGMHSIASDINPVPVLINRMLVDVPHRFKNLRIRDSELALVVNPESKSLSQQVVAKYLRKTASLLQESLQSKLKDIYPQTVITEDLARANPHLARYLGKNVDPTAWLWARSVKSPDPMYATQYTPLVSSFCISNAKGKEWYIKPELTNNELVFKLVQGRPPADLAKGTKASGKGGNFRCLYSGSLITTEYIKAQASAGEMRETLLAAQIAGNREKLFLPADAIALPDQATISRHKRWVPDIEFFPKALGFRIQNYGMSKWSDVFNDRQLALFANLSELVSESAPLVLDLISGSLEFEQDDRALDQGGAGAKAFAETVATYLAFCVSKMLDFNNTLCLWNATNQNIGCLFKMHTVSMTWDYPESNPFIGGLSLESVADSVARSLENLSYPEVVGSSFQLRCQDAGSQNIDDVIISTDPPYYDNIGYADLSDFFYVWLRHQLKDIFPKELSTISTPKASEMVATPGRHGNKKEADQFFMYSMLEALSELASVAHPDFPITIYYAFKQSQGAGESGYFSIGWEAFLEALISSGFEITSTWPVRTERESRMRGQDSNALATSLVLSCRKRDNSQFVLSRNEFRREAKKVIEQSLVELEKCGIRPIDLAQAVIGPGVSVYSSSKAVLNSDDTRMSVREALVEINRIFDECLAHQDDELDAETRYTLMLYQNYGYSDATFGEAEGLAVARNISVDSIVKSGVCAAVGGKVRIYRRDELDAHWNPMNDPKICVWESTQHLINRLQREGEREASILYKQLKSLSDYPGLTDACRSLAYRMYTYCDKNKQAEEARAYNSLVIAWSELERLAAAESNETAVQASLI